MEQTLEKRLDNMEFTLDGIESNVKSIREILTGNALNPNDSGMIGDFVTLKERVSKLEKFRDKAIWIGIGLALGAGYGLQKFIEIFKHV
jgi:hypothetical protein